MTISQPALLFVSFQCTATWSTEDYFLFLSGRNTNMTNVTITASETQKPATPAPATPQQQTQGTPTPADKPSEQQK
jgi:hypothetical protein